MSMIGCCDSAVQRMSRIGRAHTALLFLSVERDRVRTDFVAPERFVEALSKFLGGCVEFGGELRLVQHLRKRCRAALGGIHIRLHFTEGDRCVSEATIGVKHGVLRILPTLLYETRIGLSLILDKA